MKYYRLTMEKQLHINAVVESASWGLFRIMGFHWKALDYRSAVDFELQMGASEQMQPDAFVRFVEANPKTHETLKA